MVCTEAEATTSIALVVCFAPAIAKFSWIDCGRAPGAPRRIAGVSHGRWSYWQPFPRPAGRGIARSRCSEIRLMDAPGHVHANVVVRHPRGDDGVSLWTSLWNWVTSLFRQIAMPF